MSAAFYTLDHKWLFCFQCSRHSSLLVLHCCVILSLLVPVPSSSLAFPRIISWVLYALYMQSLSLVIKCYNLTSNTNDIQLNVCSPVTKIDNFLYPISHIFTSRTRWLKTIWSWTPTRLKHWSCCHTSHSSVHSKWYFERSCQLSSSLPLLVAFHKVNYRCALNNLSFCLTLCTPSCPLLSAADILPITFPALFFAEPLLVLLVGNTFPVLFQAASLRWTVFMGSVHFASFIILTLNPFLFCNALPQLEFMLRHLFLHFSCAMSQKVMNLLLGKNSFLKQVTSMYVFFFNHYVA